MKTWNMRALVAFTALGVCLGVTAPALAAPTITVAPVSVRVNIDGSPVFSVTFSRDDGSAPLRAILVSPTGAFQTSPGGPLAILGENPVSKTLGWSFAGSSVVDTVTIPASVIAEIRRRRLTQLEYARTFCSATGGCFAAPTVTIFVTTSWAVEASPLSAPVASGADTLVSVRWKLSLGGGASVRIGSREGWFKDGRGRVYGSAVSNPLQSTGRNSLVIDETLRVPESVVSAVLRARGGAGMRFERTFTVDGAVLVGTLLLQPANAIQSVSPQPARAGVEPHGSTSTGVRWDVSLLPGVTGPAGSSLSLTSSEGVFRNPEGRILGLVSAHFSQPIADPASSALSARAVAGGVVMSEQLVIPHTVIDTALSAGFTWFTFQRTFRVGGDSATGELRLDFAGRVAANFGIDRAELRFLDGSRFKNVPVGEAVQVVADITFRGSGQLHGSWDLAGPTTTPGMAIFTRKELVDEYLSFGRRTVIRSPAIKADELGVHIIRLSLTSPEFGAEDSLQLSFVVRATGAAMEISLVQPQERAHLLPDLPFAWQAVAGARSYLLEFYGAPTAAGGEPAAGLALPGGTMRALLTQSVARNLKPGRSYWWRVVALGPEGVLLGESQLRELLSPAK